MKIILNSRNKKDFQSAIFETEYLTWDDLLNKFGKKINFEENVVYSSMYGIGRNFPSGDIIEFSIYTSNHCRIKYKDTNGIVINTTELFVYED